MNFIRLYARVLKLLGDESRLGWMLALANVSLAAAQFAEPVLFGRIVDALAGAQSRGGVPVWTDLVTLLGGLGRASACSPSSAARWSRCTPTGWRTAAATR